MSKHAMRRVKISELTEPRNGLFSVYVDWWWAVSTDDEVYFFGTERSPWSSPQCNPNENVARRVHEDLSHSSDRPARYENFKETRQIPVVFVPANINDYVG
jgi:hypothetical protein